MGLKQALLAATIYNPGSKQALTTTSTSFVDIDATNLAVTFVAPASGVVFVRLEAESRNATSCQNVYWNLRDSGGDVSGTSAQITTSASFVASTRMLYVSGLTPGNSYTWKWGWRVSGGTGSHVSGGADDGPSSMLVYDAGANVVVH